MMFKVGDKVMRTCDPILELRMFIGDVFTVREVLFTGNIGLVELISTFYSSKFKLVKKEPVLPKSEIDYYRWLSERE